MTEPVKLGYKLLNAEARTPHKATEGSACFDLISTTVHLSYSRATVYTGIALDIPEDHVVLVFGRSGLARKYGIALTNGVGVIDSDYRGELQLIFDFENIEEAKTQLAPGNRVAQMMLLPIPKVLLEHVNELSSTERGSGGFGSTGS